jgi:hypothetical protein
MALAKEISDRQSLRGCAASMFLRNGTERAIACCMAGITGSLTCNHCRDLTAP